MTIIDTTECHILFGKYIKAAREHRKMSQQELADKLQVSQSYLSRIENGERDVDLAVAHAMCVALGYDLRDFINKNL